MLTDRIIPPFKSQSHEHFTYKLAEFYDNPPNLSLRMLTRAIETNDRKTTISAFIPDLGDVENVPIISLSPSTIMLIGPSWIAIFDLYKGES